MARRPKRLAVCLAAISAIAAQTATAVYVSSRNAAERSDQAGMDLLDDMVRVSQAEVAAERMVSMSRGYLLTLEPELLARAHAAEAKLQQTLQALARRANALQEGPVFDPVLVSANRYGELFQVFVADTSSSSTPRAVADALRKRLLPARDRFESDLEELIARRQQQLAGLHESTRDSSARALSLMMGISVVGLLAGIMLVRLVMVSPPYDVSHAGFEVHPASAIMASQSLHAKVAAGPQVIHLSRSLNDGPRR